MSYLDEGYSQLNNEFNLLHGLPCWDRARTFTSQNATQVYIASIVSIVYVHIILIRNYSSNNTYYISKNFWIPGPIWRRDLFSA